MDDCRRVRVVRGKAGQERGQPHAQKCHATALSRRRGPGKVGPLVVGKAGPKREDMGTEKQRDKKGQIWGWKGRAGGFDLGNGLTKPSARLPKTTQAER